MEGCNFQLPANYYPGPLQCIVTIYTCGKINVVRMGFIDCLYRIIRQFGEMYPLQYLAFCLMPDHLHMLVELINKEISLNEVIINLTRKTSFLFIKKRKKINLWQDHTRVHILRDQNGIETLAKYILENPVRRGLADTYADWPYNGGLYFKKSLQFRPSPLIFHT
jgi:putative transposase